MSSHLLPAFKLPLGHEVCKQKTERNSDVDFCRAYLKTYVYVRTEYKNSRRIDITTKK